MAATSYALLARRAGDIRVQGRESGGYLTTSQPPAGRTGIPVKPPTTLVPTQAEECWEHRSAARCPRFGELIIRVEHKRPKGPRATSAGLVSGPRGQQRRFPVVPGSAGPHPDLRPPADAQPQPQPSAHTCLETLSHVFFSRKMALRFMDEVISSTAL